MKLAFIRFGAAVPPLMALCLAAIASACSPASPASDDAADTAVADGDISPFMGTWTRTGSIVAPWFAGPGFSPEPDPEFATTPLVLAETSSSGPAILTCAAATYAVSTLPLEGLFEGNLTDIEADASALGIEANAIPTLMQGCTSATGDLELNYHLIDRNTLLLGLDNTIYQFERQ